MNIETTNINLLYVKRILLNLSVKSLSKLNKLALVLNSLGPKRLAKFNKYFSCMYGHIDDFDCIMDDFELCLEELDSNELYGLFISLLGNHNFVTFCKVLEGLPENDEKSIQMIETMIDNIDKLASLGIENVSFIEELTGNYTTTDNRVFYTDGTVIKKYSNGNRKFYTVIGDANYIILKSENRKPEVKLSGLIFNKSLPTIEEINRVKNKSLDYCTSDDNDYTILEVMENNSGIEKENSNGGHMKTLTMGHGLKETANYFLEVKEEMYK